MVVVAHNRVGTDIDSKHTTELFYPAHNPLFPVLISFCRWIDPHHTKTYAAHNGKHNGNKATYQYKL